MPGHCDQLGIICYERAVQKLRTTKIFICYTNLSYQRYQMHTEIHLI